MLQYCSMANRIVMKTSSDSFGHEKSAYQWIKEYLLGHEKRFGEIKQFLAGQGIRYADDKGLDLALKSLIKTGEIGKHRVAGNSYPLYYIKKRGLNSIAAIAQEFQSGVFHEITKFPYLQREDQESDEKYLLRSLIHTYGIYDLYVQMKSWQFTSNKKPHAENTDIRRTWFRYTLPMGRGSSLLEDGIRDLTGLRFYGTTEEFNESVSKIYENEKKQRKLIELENLLKEMYPDEMKFFEEIMAKSPDEAKKTKEWISVVLRHEAWKKRTIRKNIKNPKKSLKPNQCPVCYYDGTTKVKAGQCKGMVFPAGFVNEVTTEEGENWHCPACGHWELRKSV